MNRRRTPLLALAAALAAAGCSAILGIDDLPGPLDGGPGALPGADAGDATTATPDEASAGGDAIALDAPVDAFDAGPQGEIEWAVVPTPSDAGLPADAGDAATSPAGSAYEIAFDNAGNAWVEEAVGPSLGITRVTKYDRMGAVIWRRYVMPEKSSYAIPGGLVVDPDKGAAYVGVTFLGTVKITDSLRSNSYTGKAGTDILIVKLDTDGTVIDNLTIGSAANETVSRLARSSTGHIAFAGEFSGAVDLGTGVATPCAGQTDAYVVVTDKYTIPMWAKTYGSASAEHAYGVAIDSADNTTVTGTFYGTIGFFDGGAVTAASNGSAYAVSGAPDGGAYRWSKTWGAPDAGAAYGNGVASDSTGQVYGVGSFKSSVDFGGGARTAPTGGTSAYVVALGADGKYRWDLIGNTASGTTVAKANDVAVDPAGNVAVGGEFTGSVDLAGHTLGPFGGSDAFLAKVDGAGHWIWGRSFGGPNADRVRGVAMDPTGRVGIVGEFSAKLTYGGRTLECNAGSGETCPFVIVTAP